MKKRQLILHFLIFILPNNIYCTIVEQLQAAKQQLIAAKKNVSDGRKGLKDAYAKINSTAVEEMNKQIPDIQKQLDDLNDQKQMADDMLHKWVPMAFAVAWVPIIGIVIAVLAGTTEILWMDVPPILNGITGTIQKIKDTLQTVSNAIALAIKPLNPNDNISKPIYSKFDEAEAKFDRAIAKIDGLIEALTE